MGGENATREYASACQLGSSPRGRGKLSGIKTAAASAWLIPAWAGKTDSMSAPGRPSTAHPRVGGENRVPWQITRGCNGSSPRGRGKLRGNELVGVLTRLIPAWAGKTNGHRLQHPDRRAHPRVGGENSWASPTPPPAPGSSPRGRGKRRGAGGLALAGRLIPAWAGKTCCGDTVTDHGWAHPRVGGENMVTAYNTRTGVGSSPRGRGKLCQKKSPSPARGSSPRGRGKLTGIGDKLAATGLIPAWAGKT